MRARETSAIEPPRSVTAGGSCVCGRADEPMPPELLPRDGSPPRPNVPVTLEAGDLPNACGRPLRVTGRRMRWHPPFRPAAPLMAVLGLVPAEGGVTAAAALFAGGR